MDESLAKKLEDQGLRVVQGHEKIEEALETSSLNTIDFDVRRAMALRAALLAKKDRRFLIEKATGFKNEANVHFKEGKSPGVALKGYLTALWLLGNESLVFPATLSSSSDEIPTGKTQVMAGIQLKSDEALCVQLLLTASFCCLKLNDAEGAMALSELAHELKPSAKSALRLAKAKEALGNIDDAKALLLNYDDPVCKRELELLCEREKKIHEQPARREEASLSQQKRFASALARISPGDRAELLRRRETGIATRELTAFYAEARDREAARVGSLMTDEEKLDFAHFCNRPGTTEDAVDEQFDMIRANVDQRTNNEKRTDASQDHKEEEPPPQEDPPPTRDHQEEPQKPPTQGSPPPTDQEPPPQEITDDSQKIETGLITRITRIAYLFLFYPFLASSTAAAQQ